MKEQTEILARRLINLLEVYNASGATEDQMVEILADAIEASGRDTEEEKDMLRKIAQWADLQFCSLTQAAQHRAFRKGALAMFDHMNMTTDLSGTN